MSDKRKLAKQIMVSLEAEGLLALNFYPTAQVERKAEARKQAVEVIRAVLEAERDR